MLEYFPDAKGANYWPNHMFTMLVNCGLTVGDADEALAGALAATRSGHNAPSAPFNSALVAGVRSKVERLEVQAADAERRGHVASASDMLFRAAVLLEQLDWQFWPWSSDERKAPGGIFRHARRTFRRAVELADGTGASDGARWIAIPFEGVELEGLFVPARNPAAAGRAPVVVHLNGQHSSLHWHYQSGLPRLLAQRGVASLLFDHPGVGAARYELGLKVRPDTESYAGAAIDWIERTAMGDAGRVGVIGGSLGGYRAPRAAAFEPRVKAAVAWGAHYEMYDSVGIDYPSVAPKIADGGPFSVDEQAVVEGLHFWAGTSSLADLDAMLRALSLEGVMEKVRVPLLVVHGANDAQLPLWHAERTVAEATNSPRAELLKVDPTMGGDQHCNWDNPAFALHAMCDWLADVL